MQNYSQLLKAFQPLFNLITQGEGGLDAMNQGTMGGRIVGSTLDSQTIIGVKLTSLTLKQLIERQDYEMDTNNPQQNNYGLFAAGKFQFIPGTLKSLVHSSGIDESKLFDENTQDLLCLELIRTSAPAAYSYAQGQSNDLDKAINELASQWASLPTTSGGTAYAGTGNAASHSIDSVKQVLNDVRRNLG
ncbi:MAG: glycoside hydrolase family 104 protein [Oscillatoria sp. SIO1A7]|nr:glycoside hydrolase family 104 protein [Oscillatoria sp. SIO1A7]